jgi:hypothetical protein
MLAGRCRSWASLAAPVAVDVLLAAVLATSPAPAAAEEVGAATPAGRSLCRRSP